MATDIEESDTDDHDRPVPPKRQCTRLINISGNFCETDSQLNEEEEEVMEDAEVQRCDDAEIRAREKLKRWQACQVAKGFVDNTVNKVLEYYVMAPSSFHSAEDARVHLFRGNDMEDTAVMMAIRNHGLVQSAQLVTQSSNFCNNQSSDEQTNDSYLERQCPYSSNHTQDIENASDSLATYPSHSLRLNNSFESEKYHGVHWDADRIDDTDQQDFLERAVAEAIKKKGLSALSVDYG